MGDFAWLFFFPFALAAFLSIFIPNQCRQKELFVKILAFSLTGLIFSLANILPVFNRAIIKWLESLFRFPVDLTGDPTDLIALVSLSAAWWFWNQVPNDSKRRKSIGLISLQLSILLTMGNLPAVDKGIEYLNIHNQQIIAQSAYHDFKSTDGGYTWTKIENQNRYMEEDPENKPHHIRYHYTRGKVIKISTDDGQSWSDEYSLSPVGQAKQVYYGRREGISVFKPGPLDAVVDPQTDNIIFAMGHEGILVHSPDHDWTWVPVGLYQRSEIDSVGAVVFLLGGELLNAMYFGLLTMATITFRLVNKTVKKIFYIFAWLLFGINVVIQPAFGWDYYLKDIFALAYYLITFIFILIIGNFAVHNLFILSEQSRKLPTKVIIFGIGEFLILSTPYILWSFDVLKTYNSAIFTGINLGFLTMGSAYLLLRPHLNATSLCGHTE
jgi:hypothetical protein